MISQLTTNVDIDILQRHLTLTLASTLSIAFKVKITIDAFHDIYCKITFKVSVKIDTLNDI